MLLCSPVTAEDPVDPPEYLVEMKTVITEGSKAVKRAAKNGDPQMRLEKYLTAFVSSDVSTS